MARTRNRPEGYPGAAQQMDGTGDCVSTAHRIVTEDTDTWDERLAAMLAERARRRADLAAFRAATSRRREKGKRILHARKLRGES